MTVVTSFKQRMPATPTLPDWTIILDQSKDEVLPEYRSSSVGAWRSAFQRCMVVWLAIVAVVAIVAGTFVGFGGVLALTHDDRLFIDNGALSVPEALSFDIRNSSFPTAVESQRQGPCLKYCSDRVFMACGCEDLCLCPETVTNNSALVGDTSMCSVVCPNRIGYAGNVTVTVSCEQIGSAC